MCYSRCRFRAGVMARRVWRSSIDTSTFSWIQLIYKCLCFYISFMMLPRLISYWFLILFDIIVVVIDIIIDIIVGFPSDIANFTIIMICCCYWLHYVYFFNIDVVINVVPISMYNIIDCRYCHWWWCCCCFVIVVVIVIVTIIIDIGIVIIAKYCAQILLLLLITLKYYHCCEHCHCIQNRTIKKKSVRLQMHIYYMDIIRACVLIKMTHSGYNLIDWPENGIFPETRSIVRFIKEYKIAITMNYYYIFDCVRKCDIYIYIFFFFLFYRNADVNG